MDFSPIKVNPGSSTTDSRVTKYALELLIKRNNFLENVIYITSEQNFDGKELISSYMWGPKVTREDGGIRLAYISTKINPNLLGKLLQFITSNQNDEGFQVGSQVRCA